MARVRQSTAVRFSLRGVLIAVAVVAVYCAAIAPQFRMWSVPEQIAFAKAYGGPVLGWLASVCVLSIWRLRVERRAGTVQLSVRCQGYRWATALWVFVAAINAAVITHHAFLAAAHVRLRAEFAAKGFVGLPTLSPWYTIANGIGIGLLTVMVWWRVDRVDFCDRGILRFVRFTPWPAVDYEWLLNEPGLLLLRPGRFPIRVFVPESSCAKVNEMLRRGHAILLSPIEKMCAEKSA